MTDKSQDLDRFKRRLIRTVARMKEENVPDLWESVDKAMGKSCKNMWDLMRSLTLKKISRLLQCGDNLSRLSPASRMTLTDWLLFDMVMVHEDIDTIHTQNTTEEISLPQLKALFKLVVTHGLENCSKDTQAANWASAAMDYNAKGSQCSPMLLQRRWYELKRETRTKFYKFWEVFKRPSCQSDKPGELHKEIAAKYPHIITTEEKSWSDLMKEGKIVLPYEFERTVHMKEKTKSTVNTSGSTEDIVLIEPNIETINLENEMEDQISSVSSENMDNMDRQIACSETVNTTLGSFLEISDENEIKDETSDEHVTIEVIKKMNSRISECGENEEEDIINVEDPDETQESSLIKVELNSEETHEFVPNSVDCQVEHENITGVTDNMYASHYGAYVDVPVKLLSDKLIEDSILKGSLKECVDVAYPNPNKITAIIKEEFDEQFSEIEKPSSFGHCSTSLSAPVILKVESLVTLPETEIDIVDVNEIPSSRRKRAGPKSKTTFPPVKEFIHNDYRKPGPKCFKNRESSKISHTALNKLEDFPEVLAEYEEGSFEFADEEVDIDFATLKSLEEEHVKAMKEHSTGKRLSKMSNKVETENTSKTMPLNVDVTPECEESGTQKFDLKLLMLPLVCTQKLSDMGILKNMNLNITIFGSEAISAIEKISKLKIQEKLSVDETVELNTTKESYVYDGECLNESMDFEECIEKSVKIVKETSSLFQKPKSRKYTPITICKNPDFNTRLRRLSVAFLTSQRNRQLLKACKPLTIDLHKSFEEMLVDGIVKIRPPDKTETVEINDFDHEKSTIAPSNMAAQSLIDNETVNINELVNFSNLRETMLRMRQKPIHLPDMDTQRIINKQLKIAQVTPLNQVSPVTRTTDAVPLADTPETSIMESSQEVIIPKPLQAVSSHSQGDVSKLEHLQIVKTSLEPVLAQSKFVPPLSRVVRVHLDDKSTNIDSKVIQDRGKTSPWRPLPTIKTAPAWALPKFHRFPHSTGSFLLKEDSLARMLAALAPRQETNQIEKSKSKPLHSTKYCCTAKRHVVLNQARLRLLMTRASSDRERKKLTRELKIHQCKSFYECSCCCRHILDVPNDNTKPTDNTPSTPPREDEVATALAGLEPRKQPSPERDYTPAAVMASSYTPTANNDDSVVSPPLELTSLPPSDKGRKEMTNRNKSNTARKSRISKDYDKPDFAPIKHKRTYTRKHRKSKIIILKSSIRDQMLMARRNNDIENLSIITSDDEVQPAGPSKDAMPSVQANSERFTTSSRGNKQSFKLTEKTIVGRGIPVTARVTGTMTNAIMSRARDTWDSIKNSSRVLRKSTDGTNVLESQTSTVDLQSLNDDGSSAADNVEVVYMQLPVGTILCLKDGQIQAIDPSTDSEIKLSNEERALLTDAYMSTNTHTRHDNSGSTSIRVQDDPSTGGTGKLANTLLETVVLEDDDDDDDSPKIVENEAILETDSPDRHTPCSTSGDVETANIESDETEIINSENVPINSNIAIENQTPAIPPKKSILSDLMEISGISTEDATPYNENTYEVSQTSNESNNDPNNTKILTPLTTTPNGVIVTDAHGAYFLIDSGTGDITPLTIASSPINISQTPLQSKSSTIKINQSHDNVSRIPFILQRRRALEEKMESLKPVFHKSRKQTLNKKKTMLEAKIDLVDSDAPVYEEYLIESDSEQGTMIALKEDLYNLEIKKKLNKILQKKRKQTIVVVETDSSDEEPLSVIAAKKSKPATGDLNEPQTEKALSCITKINQSQSENGNGASANIGENSPEESIKRQESLPLETIPMLNACISTVEKNNQNNSKGNDVNIEVIVEKSLVDSQDETSDGAEDLILGI